MKRFVFPRPFIIDQIIEPVGECEPKPHAFLGALDAVRLQKFREGVTESGCGAARGVFVVLVVGGLRSVWRMHQVRTYRVAGMRWSAGAWAEEHFVQLSCDVRCVGDLVRVESQEGRDV